MGFLICLSLFIGLKHHGCANYILILYKYCTITRTTCIENITLLTVTLTFHEHTLMGTDHKN